MAKLLLKKGTREGEREVERSRYGIKTNYLLQQQNQRLLKRLTEILSPLIVFSLPQMEAVLIIMMENVPGNEGEGPDMILP